jgi:hypothetical protein
MMLKYIWYKLSGKKPDISKVPVQVVENATGTADLRAFINLLQHLVNTINKVQDVRGNVVRAWCMEDIQDVMDCFVRMSDQGEK